MGHIESIQKKLGKIFHAELCETKKNDRGEMLQSGLLGGPVFDDGPILHFSPFC